eukprot:4512583-Pleurochrysis_carterae.AAC.1
MFYAVPVATVMETMLCMGLCPISEVVLKVAVFAAASRACSLFGWTMLCKWDHPVATLPLSCALRATLSVRASTAQTTPPDDPRSDCGSARQSRTALVHLPSVASHGHQ